ncbi:MAG: UDP-N-acetylmuramoyl-tripeptide--D-alanyl-D-alanine ligase [Spirochaetaceae bacterium]|jgi:UDP-N-acetylmuramoyl-tripeptide--D-alanyl-D-alanine ligase|nr:UDP-N-acetylmuramoyl-tripeptide--D-alanyl-D-alanine ligase [Spirochaetaceae bacterium]
MTQTPFLMDFATAWHALDCTPSDLCTMNAGFSSVCIDSRQATAGSLFAALAGEKTDGHHFVHEAFRRGAAAALVERAKIAPLHLDELAGKYNAVLLPAENTLSGLQALAAAYLNLFPRLLRVGITGSSGKTTTKEIARALCRTEKQVIANAGNLNSETGLPLSVFEVRAGHEIGIFEAGMNRPGEIAELARVLRPHIALITTIGSAHIGRFGSVRAIAEEKKALFSAFSGNETALIPAAGQYAALLAENVRGKVVRWGLGLDGTPARQIRSCGLRGWEIELDGETALFPLPGKHNLDNALAALALASSAGISGAALRAGLESVEPLFGRAEIIEFWGATVVCDCYNANPESMAAAIALCDDAVWPGTRVYVAGSMLELGGQSEEAHRLLGVQLAQSKAAAVLLFGAETAAAVDAVQAAGKHVVHTTDIDALRAALKKYITGGTLVLLKGSRGCALERVLD